MSGLGVPMGIRRSIAYASVLVRARAFIQQHAASPEQCALLERALLNLDQCAADDPAPAFVHLPLLVYGAVCGDDGPAIPLAAATTLLFLGIDVLDDLQDGDLAGHWRDEPPGQVMLAAATLLAAIPQLVIAELDASSNVLASMQRRLAGGLLRMSAGQQRDLASAGSLSPSPSDIEASAASKSGEELAIFAGLAAELAGAPPNQLDAYVRMGRALGTAGQIASDCHDLFEAEQSRDLAHGARTLPLAIHLAGLTGGERRVFLDLLDRARLDPEAQGQVRRQVREGGALRRAAFVVELHCQRALRALEDARPLEPAGGEVRTMIHEVSFFRTFARNGG